MSEYLTNGAALTHTADRIRAKTGSAAKLTWDDAKGFGDAVDAISAKESIQHAEIPDYVKAEALSVAEKVRRVLKDDSIVFAAVSDFHHTGPQTDGWQTNINAGNLHACMALKVLAYSLPRLDFACMLGDVTFGNAKTTTELMQAQFDEINGWLGEAWRDVPQFRTVGNHDTGEYSTLVGAAFLKNNIGKYNEGAVYGSAEYGYCYRDFPDRKLRVICLNSCEGETTGGASAPKIFSDAQLMWFAETLSDVGGKADAAKWGILVLAHYPLDLGGAYPAGNIVKAYVNGEVAVVGGERINFQGKTRRSSSQMSTGTITASSSESSTAWKTEKAHSLMHGGCARRTPAFTATTPASSPCTGFRSVIPRPTTRRPERARTRPLTSTSSIRLSR